MAVEKRRRKIRRRARREEVGDADISLGLYFLADCIARRKAFLSGRMVEHFIQKRHQYKELGKKHPFPLSTWQTLLDESISYLTVSRLFTGLSP